MSKPLVTRVSNNIPEYWNVKESTWRPMITGQLLVTFGIMHKGLTGKQLFELSDSLNRF